MVVGGDGDSAGCSAALLSPLTHSCVAVVVISGVMQSEGLWKHTVTGGKLLDDLVTSAAGVTWSLVTPALLVFTHSAFHQPRLFFWNLKSSVWWTFCEPRGVL